MMKMILYFTFLLMMPNVYQTRMTIDNNQLIIRSNEDFEGYLYRDDQLISSIIKSDYKNGMVVMDLVEAGIYTLYDMTGKSVDQEILVDDNIHIAFDYMVKNRKGNQFLFQTHPRTTIISPYKDERYDNEDVEGCYKYEFNDDEIDFLDYHYQMHVDNTKPNVTIEGLIEIDSNTYITNNANITLVYQDTYPEIFKYINNGPLSIELKEGINDLSDYFMDLAGNKYLEECYVIFDNKAPSIDVNEKMYINEPKKLTITEQYLDYQNSYIQSLNGEKVYFDSNEFVIETNGKYIAHLLDMAGNEKTYSFEVVLDTLMPEVLCHLDGQYLEMSYTEDIFFQDLVLVYNGQNVELTEGKFFLENEGIYHLQGTLIDFAGNKNVINKEIQGDFHIPMIQTNIDKELYLMIPNIQFDIYDLFDVDWKFELYQNHHLIYSQDGDKQGEHLIVMDDLNLQDYEGIFDAVILVNDGVHDAIISKRFQIDLKCEPIDLFINGCYAPNVSEIMINNDVNFKVRCNEGVVYYRLYGNNNDIIIEDTIESINISDNQMYSKIEFYAYDAYGHQTSKAIHFLYPQVIDTFIQEDMDIYENEEKQIINTPNEKVNKIKKQSTISPINVLGGVICVLIVIRIFLYEKNRYRKNKNHLSGEKTILLQDSENTQCLCDSQSFE